MIFHHIKKIYDFFICFNIGIIFNDFFDRQYSNEYKIFTNQITNLFVNVSFNCIYYYSKCQIFFINIRNNLNLFIKANPTLLKIINYIFNSNTLRDSYKSEIIEYCDGYDFYIYNHIDNNIINKQLFYKDSIQQMCEVSDIKFILIEFKNGENIYKIDLKTDKFNYYLVSNKFTKNFFIFYIKRHLNKMDEFVDNNCRVKIIDHDINTLEIVFTDKNESIILEKTGYKLTMTNHSDNE